MDREFLIRYLKELAIYVAAYEKSAFGLTKTDVEAKIESIADDIDSLYV